MPTQKPLRINGLEIIYRKRTDLKPHPDNPNTHSPKQVKRIARAICDFGWTNPIIIDEQGNVLAGHGRLLAAAMLGIDEVPTIIRSDMSQAQKQAYLIADNRLSEIGGTWDKKLLAREHEAIRLLDPEFDLTSTGFELDDIDIMLDGLIEVDEDQPPEPDRSRPAVSRLNDLWQLDDHRLFNGNSLHEASFTALMQGALAQMVISDVPYNVRINGNCVGKGRHREFEMASGEMSRTEFAEFLTTAFSHFITFSQDGSIHFLFMDWRHMAEMVLATSQYTEQKNLIVWDKVTVGLGAFFRSGHELIWVMKSGTAKHINNIMMGKNGRDRSNIWRYQGLNGATEGRQELLALHPTVKPLKLVSDAILDCSKKGGLILDPFCGSGTILLAAEKTGRRAAAIELDPYYVDTAIRRWQSDTGKKAYLADDGRSFDEIEQGGRES